MLALDNLNRTDYNFIEIEKILNIKITNYTRICSLSNDNKTHTLFKVNFPNNNTYWGINNISDENFFSKFNIEIPFIKKKNEKYNKLFRIFKKKNIFRK